MTSIENKALFFQTINNASATLGVGQSNLRKGIKAGKIPHIRIGNRYYINIPLYIEQMNQQSKANMTESNGTTI